VLHEVQNVDFVTVTRTVQEEIVVTEQLVQTQLVTDYNQVWTTILMAVKIAGST